MGLVVVTGANRGIGLALCRRLAERQDRVLAVCRSSSAELGALPVRMVTGIDVTLDSAALALRQAVGDEKVSLLVHNAGVYRSAGLEHLDFDEAMNEFNVNALGPLRLTRALLPALADGAKIVFIGSLAGSIGDNRSGGGYGYRMSKAAANMASVCLARELRDRGVAVVSIHPGMVATENFGRALGSLPALDEAASSALAPDAVVPEILARIDELTLASSGTFIHRDGRELPW